MLYYENKAKSKGYSFVVGVDEAGRGPLAGPLVAAAVSLKNTRLNSNINDSKQLTCLQRRKAFEEIYHNCLVGISIVSESVIDANNILKATQFAMQQAVINLITGLHRKINKNKIMILVDGNVKLSLPFKCKTIIKGDSKSLSIASASIVAKVTRDRIMAAYAQVFPDYNFAQHKGYGTKQHFKALRKFGPCQIHRRSFKLSKSFVSKD